MSKGSNPTPPQLTLRYSKRGQENLDAAWAQLHAQKVPTSVIGQFHLAAKFTPEAGQFEPLNKAAETIGAEVHWID